MSLGSKKYLYIKYNRKIIVITFISDYKCSVKKFTEIISALVGFSVVFIWDKSKLDGASRKILNSIKLKSLSREPKIRE